MSNKHHVKKIKKVFILPERTEKANRKGNNKKHILFILKSKINLRIQLRKGEKVPVHVKTIQKCLAFEG